MDKTPMTFETFKYYMDRLKEEYDWREACAKLDIDVGEHMDSFYYALDLLSMLFHDTEEILQMYVFEGEWGTKPEWSDINNLETLYQTLIIK